MTAAEPERRRPGLREIVVAGDLARWEAAGFEPAGGVIRAGGVAVRVVGDAPPAILAWTLSDAAGAEIDGLPAGGTAAAPADAAPAAEHPNTCVGIDHVVVLTPDLERTGRALAAAGAPLRRIREAGDERRPVRQGFVRLGPAILEIVTTPDVPPGPASFWGITFVVSDIDRAAALLGERLGSVRDAVQPGRRIATLRREAGLGIPVALMTPDPPGR